MLICVDNTIWTHLGLYYDRFSVLKRLLSLTLIKILCFKHFELRDKTWTQWIKKEQKEAKRTKK